MKKFILGFIAALVLVGLIYFGYPFIRGFFGGGGPVTSDNLIQGAKDFGSLKVLIFGKGQPLPDVEVDLGTVGAGGPNGPMSFAITDANGAATFEKVPVGKFNLFFNTNHFPAGYAVPAQATLPLIEIVKNQPLKKRVDLPPR